ncbi:hypothetical protein KRR26_12750 [Corallococcus sp. M34]|uniref:hypothetical protein n=1 Tax=Citreicoccus inhibens TaxID=2849499 RepID=UPI001C24EEBB|nr:hypothetical protein [Citreicoccus inhibens]MBU8896483.1 hypothetical protein [Citreicoccus inhibens]
MGETIIGRLKLRGADLEPLSAKLRLESLLSGAHLASLGLPPSATVCIRRLADPRPGMLPVRQLAVRPPPLWEEAWVKALRAQVASAARPAQGAVPAGTEAVLFLDRAELLACLASDVCRGTAALNWWWRGLFPAADFARCMVEEWLRRPEYVPAALIHVASRRETSLVAARFSEDEARVLLARVCEVHGLTALSLVMNEPLSAGMESVAASTSAIEHPGPVTALRPAPPWESWAPETQSLGASIAHQAWIGVSLMIQRAPAVMRLAPFIEAARAWRQPVRPPRETERREATPLANSPEFEPTQRVAAPRASSATGADSAPSPYPLVADSPRRAPDALERALAEAAPESLPIRREAGPRRVTAAPRSSSDLGTLTHAPQSSDGSVSAATLDSIVEARSTSIAPTASEQVQAPVDSGFSPSSTVRLEPPSARAWGLPIATALGGLFYLVNLGLFLELYGDFSQPRFQGLSLSIWDFVALVGRRLLSDIRPNDPVWTVLAQLAGRRPGEAPGHGFEPPHTWRIRPAWLHAFRAAEAHPWTWSVTGGRLRVRHPRGFLVLDVPTGSDDTTAPHPSTAATASLDAASVVARDAVEALLLNELAPYGVTDMAWLELGVVPAPEATSPLERWLAWLMPYVRARLARALGLAPGEEATLERRVFAHDALLHLTATHVDVVLSLARLPLEVRVAGLDRDVGWLPAAGRHLTFHFD